MSAYPLSLFPSDAERVAAIDRDADLRLLERLLIERERPVPPPPNPAPAPRATGATVRGQLVALMMTIAEAVEGRTA